MKKYSYLLLSILLTIVLVGCKSEESVTENNEEQITPVEEIEEEEIIEEPSGITAPLTGLEVDEEVTKRPIAVVINNDVKARPQSGLYKADVVVEILSEGDITRLIAIYQSELPEKVGPVRSARDYFLDIAKPYNPIFVAHGYSPAAKQRLDAGELDSINGMLYDGTLFKRASFRQAPHNSYISFENIEKGASELGFNMEGETTPYLFLSQNEEQELNGVEINKVKINYSTRLVAQVAYEYSKEDELFQRYSGGERTKDLETLEDVVAQNIFIIETAHEVVDKVGRREINLTAGGRAVLIQQGKRYELEWKEDNGRLIPVKDGQPVPFTPGKTWVNIVPSLDFVHYE
ncbi:MULTISPECIES: DUF3048 domain-containing protein [Bacillus]|uniref:DUF3048 domain-containing protein n=1 Tax=Bacillus TaxID=1386 RepID=UPI000BB851EF|nr:MULTISPECIES: DUF3048 domain-containing protein [Bacillus]